MRCTQAISVAIAACRVVRAHYIFPRLIVEGAVTPTFYHVREVGPLGGSDQDLVNPMYDIFSTDLRCGRNAATTGPGVKTVTLQAGATVGFEVGNKAGVIYIFHPGPGSAWLSKAPSDLESYTGDGDWFKIASVVEKSGKDWNAPGRNYTSNTDWFMYGLDRWNFTIPTSTPPGKYLLRIEHFFPWFWPAEYPDTPFTQFYAACAHVEIVGEGGGTPGPMVKIPGLYKSNQSDVYFEPKGLVFNLTDYRAPYPPVWQG